MDKEYIICAANYYDDGEKHIHQPRNIEKGFVVCGRRHHNCIATFTLVVGFPYNEKGLELMRTEIQGFLTNTDRFVGREEARTIALESGQLAGRTVHGREQLFSEDLY